MAERREETIAQQLEDALWAWEQASKAVANAPSLTEMSNEGKKAAEMAQMAGFLQADAEAAEAETVLAGKLLRKAVAMEERQKQRVVALSDRIREEERQQAGELVWRPRLPPQAMLWMEQAPATQWRRWQRQLQGYQPRQPPPQRDPQPEQRSGRQPPQPPTQQGPQSSPPWNSSSGGSSSSSGGNSTPWQ